MEITGMNERFAALGFSGSEMRAATDEERATVVSELSPVDGLGWVRDETQIGVLDLPFYDHVDLLVASDPAWEPDRVIACWLRNGATFWRLDGRSPQIHDVNGKIGTSIDTHSAMPYLRFFCYFVRGEEGPFLVADETSLTLLEEDVQTKIREMIEAPEFMGEDRHGALHAAATIVYGSAVFAARFKIQVSGLVEMLEDEPILDGLPVVINAPLSLTGPQPE